MRAARIVGELQTFVRPQPPDAAPVDLHQIVARVVTARTEARGGRDGVAIEQHLADDVPLVLGDAGQLEQAVVNPLRNAEEAVTGAASGRIVVRLNVHDAKVRLSVADTGPAIPADILSRIFEPFFSTKAPNQNAWLGLPVAYSIVQHHGGRLLVESTAGWGATFVVELPAHAAAAPSASAT